MTIQPMTTLTVRQLRAILEDRPDDAEVRIWLPGSRIALTGTRLKVINQHQVLIEGNVEPGSALDQATL
jgi:hypothetical protein